MKINRLFYRPFKKKCWLPGCLRAVSGFVTAEMETLCMLFTFIPNFGQIESVYGSNMGVLSPLFTFYGHFAGYLWTILLGEYRRFCNNFSFAFTYHPQCILCDYCTSLCHDLVTHFLCEFLTKSLVDF